MFDLAVLEGDGPVGVVIPDWRWNEKAPWQFGVDHDFGAAVQFFDEVSLVFAVGENVVVNVPLGLHRLAEVFLWLPLREDVAAVRVIDRIVGKVLDDDRRFLLVDQPGGFGDKVFGIRLVLTKDGDIDDLQDACNRVTSQLRLLSQFANQVVLHGGLDGRLQRFR